MLQVARLSSKMLGESTPLVAEFFTSQYHPEGGFCDRAGKQDLYYTTFGMAGLTALQVPLRVEPLQAFLLSKHGELEQLSLVDLSCLARCWAGLPAATRPPDLAHRVMGKLAQFRTADGGYGAGFGEARGTLYGCYVALSAAQDVGQSIPDPAGLRLCIESLRAQDGGYSNSHDLPMGLTPPTAAAVSLMRILDLQPPASLRDWLLARMHPEGGFCAGPAVFMPDLLSTATALHALSSLHADFEPIREPCLDFLDTLWTARGGFHGTWEDDALDIEYTYYGLLALGHLSL